MLRIEQLAFLKRLQPVLLVVVFFVICVAYALELSFFRQIVDLRELILGSLLVGLPIGYEVGLRLSRPLYDLTQRFITRLAVMIMILMLMPLLGSWLNRGLAFRAPVTLRAEVYQNGAPGFVNPLEGAVLVWHPEVGIVRTTTDSGTWSRQPAGTPLEVDLRRGLFGVRYLVPNSVR